MPITGAPDRLGRLVRLIRWITLQATLAGAHQGASTLSLPERSRAGPTTSPPAWIPLCRRADPRRPRTAVLALLLHLNPGFIDICRPATACAVGSDRCALKLHALGMGVNGCFIGLTP